MNNKQTNALIRVLAQKEKVSKAQGAVEESRVGLGQSIREAMAADVSAPEIAKALGYTRARIYQLADLAKNR